MKDHHHIVGELISIDEGKEDDALVTFICKKVIKTTIPKEVLIEKNIHQLLGEKIGILRIGENYYVKPKTE